MTTTFAIVKSAGLNKGTVRSVHRGFGAAMKAQPFVFYAMVKVEDRKVRVGDILDISKYTPAAWRLPR